jgi:hypothetical protein
MIARTIRALEWLALGLSALAIFAVMVIVCLDVAFRYPLIFRYAKD